MAARARVGIVGVGAMGMPMAQRLLAAGHHLSFFARRDEAAGTLEALGARRVPDLPALGAASEVAVVCVFTDGQVLDVCLGPGGLLAAMQPGAVLVNHTTGSPSSATRLSAEAARRNVRFLDAALSGAPAAVAAGRLALLVGGEPSTLDELRPVLAAYADPIVHVGAPGDGQRVKLVNNALFAANIALAGAAEQLAASLGVDPALALSAITHCSGDSFSLRTVVAAGSAARAQQQAGPFIRKDVAMVERVAGELGVELGILGTVARQGW